MPVTSESAMRAALRVAGTQGREAVRNGTGPAAGAAWCGRFMDALVAEYELGIDNMLTRAVDVLASVGASGELEGIKPATAQALLDGALEVAFTRGFDSGFTAGATQEHEAPIDPETDERPLDEIAAGWDDALAAARRSAWAHFVSQ